MDQAKRLKAFDKENPRLKKQVADLSLDKQILVAIGRSVGRHGSQVVEGFEYLPGSADAAPRGFWCRQPTGIGDNEIWRIVKRNGILYLPDVGLKTTSFCSAFAGIFASN